MDGAPPPRAVYDERGKYYGYNAWLLRGVPADLNETSDPVINGYEPTAPPKGGVVARITTFVPGYTYPMHETETVDFGIVLSGRIEMGVETGTVLLNPGDLVVQRGTLRRLDCLATGRDHRTRDDNVAPSAGSSIPRADPPASSTRPAMHKSRRDPATKGPICPGMLSGRVRYRQAPRPYARRGRSCRAQLQSPGPRS